mmetsp:Transcript_70604/g.216352  ORF Transcript_70604/g.216352 Transcript_70604/m.216352 type:complete len:281 (-) Transcript_70604:48-890(-)
MHRWRRPDRRRGRLELALGGEAPIRALQPVVLPVVARHAPVLAHVIHGELRRGAVAAAGAAALPGVLGARQDLVRRKREVLLEELSVRAEDGGGRDGPTTAATSLVLHLLGGREPAFPREGLGQRPTPARGAAPASQQAQTASRGAEASARARFPPVASQRGQLRVRAVGQLGQPSGPRPARPGVVSLDEAPRPLEERLAQLEFFRVWRILPLVRPDVILEGPSCPCTGPQEAGRRVWQRRVRHQGDRCGEEAAPRGERHAALAEAAGAAATVPSKGMVR